MGKLDRTFKLKIHSQKDCFISLNLSISRFRRDAAILKTDRTSAGLKRRSQITDHGSHVTGSGSQVTDMIIINRPFQLVRFVFPFQTT